MPRRDPIAELTKALARRQAEYVTVRAGDVAAACDAAEPGPTGAALRLGVGAVPVDMAVGIRAADLLALLEAAAPKPAPEASETPGVPLG